MTSKLIIPTISKDNKMAEGIRSLIGRKMTKTVKFMGEDVKISKLSVAEVMDVQEQAKSLEASDTGGFDILRTVIRASVEGASDLSDEDFRNFPVDELSKLSNEVMKFSGIGQDQGK
jgi:hypothetical protein